MKDRFLMTFVSLGLIMTVALTSFELQIRQGASLRNDLVSRFTSEAVKAPRGMIFDRFGRILAENKASYSLYLQPLEISGDAYFASITTDLSTNSADLDFIKTKYEEVKNTLAQNKTNSEKQKNIPDKILIDKDFKNPVFITKYLADPQKWTGLKLESDSQRIYPQKDLVAHLLGYTGEVTEDDQKFGYSANSEIGRAGVESSYDTVLRGEDGKLSIDNRTKEMSLETPPTSGKNIYLSVDLDIQKKMYQVLSDGIKTYGADGAIGILQNVKTGEILAYVSLPSYDDNLFVGGIGIKDFEKLNNDPKSPQLDRISDTTYPPGSVFKLNTDTTLLETNSIDRNTTFPTGGTWKYGGVTFRDFSNIDRGTINVVRALCVSSNLFHMKASLQMDSKTNGRAIDQIDAYGKAYGLGQKTGIDVPEGFPGYISSPAVKKDLYNTDWVGGDLLNTVIGQGYTLLSPIQIQTMVTAIATNGNLLQPHVLYATSDSLESNNKTYATTTIRNTLNYSPNTYSTIKDGMYCGVHDKANGIIQDLNSPYVNVSAKSGTAEFGAPDPVTGAYPNRHGWAVGFFPTENPQYSFTMLLERGGTSNNTVKLARNFIDWLYTDYKINDKLK